MAIKAGIKAISYALPENRLTNEELAELYPDWSVDKIAEKTGIEVRHIASKTETASSLGIQAAEKLFAEYNIDRSCVDYLLFCTQSPDYFLPTSACLIQEKLRLSIDIGALDINLGCSGFVYGLGLAKGIIESGQAQNIVLITADSYSKYIHENDKSVRTLFGDGAAATLISAYASRSELIGSFVYGTDGRGAENLIVPHGGCKYPISKCSHDVISDDSGNKRTLANLYMNGSEIYTFTLRTVPAALASLLDKSGLAIDDIDLFILHQANKFMLDSLQKKLKIPDKKFHRSYSQIGNTVSASIPIGLCHAAQEGLLHKGTKIAIIGFGVGYSWGAALLKWVI